MYNTYKYNDNTPDLRHHCARFAAKRARARMIARIKEYTQIAGATVALVAVWYIAVVMFA